MAKILEYFENQACFLLFGVATACVTAGVYELNAPTRKIKAYEILDIKFEKEYEEAKWLKNKREANEEMKNAMILSPYCRDGKIPSLSSKNAFPHQYQLDHVDPDTKQPFTATYTGVINKWPY